jgi:hypothetical protein
MLIPFLQLSFPLGLGRIQASVVFSSFPTHPRLPAFLETGSHCIAQVGLQLAILQSQSPDDRQGQQAQQAQLDIHNVDTVVTDGS